MAVLIIFPVILQTVINLIMLSIVGQGQGVDSVLETFYAMKNWNVVIRSAADRQRHSDERFGFVARRAPVAH